jgi:hypothetical protein
MKKIMLSVLALSFVVGLTDAQASGIEKADFSSEMNSPMNKVLINRPFRVSPISWYLAPRGFTQQYNPAARSWQIAPPNSIPQYFPLVK